MAQTSTGALKAVIEAANLNLSVYRDHVEAEKAYPYVTVDERISYVPDPTAAKFDRGTPPGFVEHAQINLWQTWRSTGDGTNVKVEDRTLARKLMAAIRGRRLYVNSGSDGTINGAATWGVKVISAQRFIEEDQNIVHDVITVAIPQELY